MAQRIQTDGLTLADRTAYNAAVMRVGAVNYLNSKPLVCGLEQHAPDLRLSFDLPSRLADSLAAGRLDVALIPTVEFFRAPGYSIVSDACVACRGPVLSVKLHFRVPPPQVRRVALDEGSRTSAALTKILLAQLAGVRPTWETLPIGCGLEATDADAVLLIGDRAITCEERGARGDGSRESRVEGREPEGRVEDGRGNGESNILSLSQNPLPPTLSQNPLPLGEGRVRAGKLEAQEPVPRSLASVGISSACNIQCPTSDFPLPPSSSRSSHLAPHNMPVPSPQPPAPGPNRDVWDLGGVWCRWTGLPFVFAMWIARPEVDASTVAATLAAARDEGVRQLAQIAAREAAIMQIPEPLALDYLRDNLHFVLGPQERHGLRRFHQLCVAHEIIPSGSELGFVSKQRAASGWLGQSAAPPQI